MNLVNVNVGRCALGAVFRCEFVYDKLYVQRCYTVYAAQTNVGCREGNRVHLNLSSAYEGDNVETCGETGNACDCVARSVFYEYGIYCQLVGEANVYRCRLERNVDAVL